MERKNEDWASILNFQQRTRHPYIMYELIHAIPTCLEGCLREQKDNIWKIAEELTRRGIKSIYIIGSGNSFYSAIAGKYAIEKIARITSIPEESFELLHYTIPSLSNFDNFSNFAVVGISLSGRTKACVDAIKIASEKGGYTIGVVGEPGSPMERYAKMIVIPRGVRKDVPVRISTFQSVTFTLNLLAVALREKSKGKDAISTHLHEQMNNMPKVLRKVIEEVEPFAIELGKKYVTDEDFYFIGGGPNYGTALDGALMINEMSRGRPWAWEIEEMCHGPWSTLRRKSIVIIISPPGESHQRAEMLARAIKDNVGCTIISLVRKGETSELVKKSDYVIEIPENVDEVLSPILYDVPLHLFAYYRAVSGGINPDAHGMDIAGFNQLVRELHPPGWH